MQSARGTPAGRRPKKTPAGGKGARLDARGVADVLAMALDVSDELVVVTGGEEALRRLVVDRILGQAAGRDISVLRVSARDADAANLVRQGCEPTLFGGATWLLVTELDQGNDDVVGAAKDAITQIGPDLRIVFVHGGAARGRGVIAAAQKAGARVIEVRPVAASALPSVLTTHARQRDCILSGEAAAALIDTLGPDLTGLLATVEQLASDAPDGRISLQLVRDTLTAGGTENQFEIADLVWKRETAAALAAFRQLAERNGASGACVTVVAALSYSLRSLARFSADRPTGSPWQIASALGVPMWKVDAIAAAARLWRPGQLARAAVLLADADADAKGGLGDSGALDPEQKLFAVERLIQELAG